MQFANAMYIVKNKWTMSLPVWSRAYRRWCERTQPRQVKTPAPPLSCDGEPSQKWPRGGSWCSSERCPGKRLFCEGYALHQDCTVSICAIQIHCVLYFMLLLPMSSLKT